MSLLGLSCKVARVAGSHVTISTRGIISKALREVKDKPAPYDWKNKNYPLWYSLLFDKTSARFDENTKVIIVEGPVASGKTAFAKELADQLDMCHMEDVNMDQVYINAYGYDMRKLDPQMPDDVKSFDETKFNQNPTGRNAASFQAWMYRLRYSRYIDCLAHVLSTGQGVVLERSPWTDSVFTDTMAKHNYISKAAQYTISELRRATFPMLMKPHLVIYLDVPVSKVQENIKKRNKFGEASGKALTTGYLEDMEEAYKTKYLPQISEHAELMMYDWSTPGEVEVVVEDIERLNFDQYTKHDKKLNDWLIQQEKVWGEKRMLYSDDKLRLMWYLNVPILEAPEMWASGEDQKKWLEVWESAPGEEFAPGFNAAQGDTGLLFNIKVPKYVPF